jgi:Retrotransposon gag protein
MNDLDMPVDHDDPLVTPENSSTPQLPPDPVVNITLGMWNHLVNRLSSLEALLESRSRDHERALEALDNEHKTLRNRYNALEREHYDQAVLNHKSSHHQEPKIPDPPMFSGERKDLLPFLTKCQIKFDGQPSRFPNEKSKILYVGSRLEGPAFSWFQPLIATNPDGSAKPAPPELASFKVFSDALTVIYGDPNLEATAIREIRRLIQTGSAAEYAAKFESKKQYMHWNDEALRDQFYLNLKEELKDEIAPVGKPKTYLDLKALAIRLDARLFERRLERSNATTRPPPAKPASRPFTWATPSTNSGPAPAPAPPPVPAHKPAASPSGGLRVPSQTADGTVPMELDASGMWHLTENEKARRRTLGLCLYCGEKGHSPSNCPVAPPSRRRPPPNSNRQFMTFEVQPEKDDTQE